MSSRSWLEALKPRFTPPLNRHPRRDSGQTKSSSRSLRVEMLEDRRLLAFVAAASYPVGTSPQGVVAADFDNDTLADLAVANYSSSSVSVLLGNPDGTFQPALTTPVGASPLSLAVGDFNEDGNLDIATASYYDVRVMLGDGLGSFGAPNSMGVVGNPQSVAVGDFNGDGKLDLGVTSNLYYWGYYGYYYGYYGSYEGYANVLLGNADGTFSEANSTYLGVGYHTTALAADLNGDVYDDFVAHNSWYGYVTVLTGDISGFLQGPTGYLYTGDYSYAVAAGDVDGDGDNDLVTANFYGNSVGVLLNNGAGGFSGPVNYSTGGYAASLVLGDFTGDGNLDVATANGSSNQVAVLHGSGDGTFSLPVLSAAGASPWSIAAGDFDGDGWLDAATGNAGSSNVSVLINDQSWPVPVPPSVTISDVTKSEGQRNTTAFSFTVSLSEPSSQWVTVSFATADGTATTADNDYIAATGTVSFAPGQTTATITVWVRGDKKKEADETFFVNLTGATGATIDDGQGLGTINSDDGGKGNGKGPKASLAAALDAEATLTKSKKLK